jgi:hypothetical protein
MATASNRRANQRAVAGAVGHEGFLQHKRMRWLKIGLAISLLAIVGYVAIPAAAGPYGGSWFGYMLGTTGAGLILWLAMLGIRKRAMTTGRWSLKAWTSAHVWLGLSLIVVATLHTGLKLGWNLATLAWALMMLVIGSGIYGIVVYSALPLQLARGRERQTRTEMMDGLRIIDRQLQGAAQPLGSAAADQVRAAMAQDPFKAGLSRRLSGSDSRCATRAAIEALRAGGGEALRAGGGEALRGSSGEQADAITKVLGLMAKRRNVLERIREQLRLRAMLEVWLYVHVPLTVALLAALSAHIISVFYYW